MSVSQHVYRLLPKTWLQVTRYSGNWRYWKASLRFGQSVELHLGPLGGVFLGLHDRGPQ